MVKRSLLQKAKEIEDRKIVKKSKQHIIERLIGRLPVSGHKGKKHYWTSGEQIGSGHTLFNIMFRTLDEIERKTKKNPVEVVVRAIENSSPREEVTTVQYGGIKHPKAVDCAPQRRVDLSLRWMTQGAFQASNKSKRRIWSALADEIIAAANNDKKSNAVSKKFEVERQAAASR